MRKECNKQQLLLEEQATTQLPIQRQNATYMKQQPPQMLKEQQVQNENQFQQFGPYDETLHQVNHATDSSQGQASAAPSIQQQQPVQDYQQQHQQNEQQQMQQQRQQQNQQQQEQQKQVQQQQQQQQQMQQQQQQQIQQQQMQQQRQQIEQQRQQQSYNHTPEYDNPQFQNFDRPRFPSTSSSIQYQEQQQPILSSFPEFSHQDPSRSQQVHRSTSLPYIATSTSIQQTNNQQSQQQSNSLVSVQSYLLTLKAWFSLDASIRTSRNTKEKRDVMTFLTDNAKWFCFEFFFWLSVMLVLIHVHMSTLTLHTSLHLFV